MTAYDELMSFTRETEALAAVAGRTGWDQETMMPAGAAEMRGEEMAALEGVLHARRTDPRVGDWLEAAEPADDIARAQLREIRRSYARSVKLPARLATELARVTSVSQGEWAAARKADDWAAFEPRFAQVVKLKQEEGAALAEGGSVYDALLEDYEPGTSGAQIAALFDGLRPRLVALRERILGSSVVPPKLSGEFDEAAQLALSARLATTFGYDLSRGRIDKAVHPFSSGSGTDVRITTRTDPADPFNCFYSTIHEVGHATYEQKVDPAYLLTPLGSGASMGVHESQSRIYENQLGRSRAFTSWLFHQMQETFGDLRVGGPDDFYAAVNRVHAGFIRTEADEVHYNLHVMLRFDLERALISGDLAVADLPGAWNERFARDFGAAVDRPSNGVLQDVHWPVGLFGYFPTYALGNVYAGCLHKALREALPDLDAQLAEGDLSAALGWLAENLQQHGSRYAPRETILRATGAEPEAGPLLDYLEEKFGAIYGL
ncbi:carboxypeptidase M32 [Poseidonocella sp. HB161398]|uniref:carboxypeptidase M32 n=1 Tax=Poseidonocella sp. HB161398 TaxID=2320855 RepID=UPI001109DAED|nr:carboxypeptidase M32 [Poseidonocella sp. HB161398]